jgi:glucosyl-dolichyl phosphate glucuronosyltransferase
MKITVILCTYNRCASLRIALESVARSVVPASVEWELLLVNNNSSDQTRSVFEEFNAAYPGRFRYLFEPKPGKSNALNSAIEATDADVLAFMDDDVLVEPTWLANLTSVLNDPSYAGVGGKIVPQWKTALPRWLPVKEKYGLAPLVMFDLGNEAGALDEPPFGTNMAFRRSVFDRYARFRTDLGPRPGSEIRSEDTEFGQRLLNAGERLYYQPSAVVYHEVAEKRLKKEFFLKWTFDKARADIREFGVQKGTKWFIAGVPLYLFRRLAVWTVRWMAGMNPAVRFARKLKIWSTAGAIRECYRSFHQRRLPQAGAQSPASPSVKS